ncbi:BRCT domain-containing protein, partial [Macrolepiota fuliginosa MF-IS2]
MEKEKRRDKQQARAIVECDVLVTRWRNGRAYGNAFRLHRTIGTLAWLYYVQSTGLTPRPVDQLLHYPIPRRQIDNFNAHEITVTNYTGEAREYIKRLITAMGATFTPSMTGRNTVLIAAYIHGIKAEKARAWSIPVVNHTWLEDCFIQWRHLTPATEKYIIFPEGVDFSKLLGERGVGVRGIELCDDEEAKE